MAIPEFVTNLIVAAVVLGPVAGAVAWVFWRFWRLVRTDLMLRRMNRDDVLANRAKRRALGLPVPDGEPTWRAWR